MLVEEETLRKLLRVDAAARIDVEEAPGPSRAERVIVHGPEGGELCYIVRCAADAERARNHSAVMEAVSNANFPAIPRLIAVHGDASIEEEYPGLALISVRPELTMMEAVIDALAAMHGLDVREGLDYEKGKDELLLEAEPPLHRLGFASREREPAMAGFAGAHRALRQTPFGLCHRELTASNVLVGRNGVAFANFDAAGYGPQIYDLAAVLATSGLLAPAREHLARRYAERTGVDADTLSDLADLATISWGVRSELGLPRRQIEVMGDEAGMERLVLESTRIQQALRERAGRHPLAAAIRGSLWPQ